MSRNRWTVQINCAINVTERVFAPRKVLILYSQTKDIAMGLTNLIRAISADFMSMIGKYFQIRDDYMNLMDKEVQSPPSQNHNGF